jgi:hypothetical protein
LVRHLLYFSMREYEIVVLEEGTVRKEAAPTIKEIDDPHRLRFFASSFHHLLNEALLGAPAIGKFSSIVDLAQCPDQM